jgi:hypothetical protein
MIAERVIAARRETWEEETEDGEPLKRTLGIHFSAAAQPRSSLAARASGAFGAADRQRSQRAPAFETPAHCQRMIPVCPSEYRPGWGQTHSP